MLQSSILVFDFKVEIATLKNNRYSFFLHCESDKCQRLHSIEVTLVADDDNIIHRENYNDIALIKMRKIFFITSTV